MPYKPSHLNTIIEQTNLPLSSYQIYYSLSYVFFIFVILDIRKTSTVSLCNNISLSELYSITFGAFKFSLIEHKLLSVILGMNV